MVKHPHTGVEMPKPMGRKLGSKNKTKLQFQKAMISAFHRAGGDEYLYKLSKTDKPLFCMLLAKVIPSELKVSGTLLVDVSQALVDGAARASELENVRASALIDVTPQASVVDMSVLSDDDCTLARRESTSKE